MEIAGADPTTPINAHAIQNVTTASTTAVSPSITTSKNGCLVVGYEIAAGAMSFAGPWTLAATLEGAPVCIQQSQATAGAIQATWSQSSQAYAAGVVALAPAPASALAPSVSSFLAAKVI